MPLAIKPQLTPLYSLNLPSEQLESSIAWVSVEFLSSTAIVHFTFNM